MNVLRNEIKFHLALLKVYFLGFVMGLCIAYLIADLNYGPDNIPYSLVIIIGLILGGPLYVLVVFISIKNQQFNLNMPWDQIVNQVQSQKYHFIRQSDNHFIFEPGNKLFGSYIVLINNGSSFILYGPKVIGNRFKKRFGWQSVKN